MIYQIDSEYLDEYIDMKKLELGDEIVEHLSNMKEETTDTYTKEYLQEFISDYSEEFKICKYCFRDLTPVIADEAHRELDNCFVEKVVTGWKCDCGSKYFY